MEKHPITDYPCRWIPTLIAALCLLAIQVVLLLCYTDTDWLPAFIDSGATIGWFMALAYLAWFITGTVSIYRTNLIIALTGILVWLAGSFMVCDIMVRIAGVPYISFASTIPFRLLFGIPAYIAVLLWYRLQTTTDITSEENSSLIYNKEEEIKEKVIQEENIDRITVKEGSRIHIIKIEDLLYIQACGDYTTLVTPTGEYIKEQTMKYFQAHLPEDSFVRIHRSNIVNLTQISRLELFGKESYQLILKNGTRLRVSLSGYRSLKEKLGI